MRTEMKKLKIFFSKKKRAYSHGYVSIFLEKNMKRIFIEFHNQISVLG